MEQDNKETNLGTKKDIENSTARIWTKAEMKVTVKQAKANGFSVTKGDSTLTIIDTYKGKKLLSAILMRNTWLVRIDRSYFGK
jgi:hypothetical protein